MTEEQNPYSSLNYILELTPSCNHGCYHCYNIWKLPDYKPLRQTLDTKQWKFLIDKLYEETKCRHIALSGGEPTLRSDFLEILEYIYKLGIRTVLITNGSRLTKEIIKGCRERGVTIFELPLLGPNKEIHNEISRGNTWDELISAIVNIKSMGGRVFIVHVSSKKNISYFEDILKLAIALDTDGMMLNRFNPGGEGVKYMNDLLVTAEEFEVVLGTANRLSYEYRYPVSCSIAIHPCIIDMSKYPYLGTGFCGAGTDRAYYTIGPDGALRPCNHTSTVLGDFMTEKFEDMINNDIMKDFVAAIPPICEPCPMAKECQGGCKAAAEVTYGSPREMDPFLKENLHRHPAYGGEKEYSGEFHG